MDRRTINTIGALAPVAMSLAGLALVLVVVLTGWERNLTDEGAAAHTFRLLIVAQAPFVLAFLATADWKRFATVARPLALQAAALIAALGSVAVFRL